MLSKVKEFFKKNHGSKEENSCNLACSIIVSVLEDEPLQLCMNNIGNTIKILKIFKERYVSKRRENRVALHLSIYTKKIKRCIAMNK